MILDNPFAKNDGTDPVWLERFVAKIDIRGENECWEWLGSQSSPSREGKGYGDFYLGKVANGKTIKGKAHKLAWQLINGEPTEEKPHVLHRCDVRSCCNPSHLFIGTHDDNMKDMAAKGRAKGVKAGEKHSHAAITDIDADEIRQLYRDSDLTYEQIAEIKGIKKSTVSNIVRVEGWTHVKSDEVCLRPIIRHLEELPRWVERLWAMHPSELHPRDEIGKRVIAIRDMLNDGNYHTAVKIAEALKINRATISRTAKYLICAGKIEMKKATGYRLIK